MSIYLIDQLLFTAQNTTLDEDICVHEKKIHMKLAIWEAAVTSATKI